MPSIMSNMPARFNKAPYLKKFRVLEHSSYRNLLNLYPGCNKHNFMYNVRIGIHDCLGPSGPRVSVPFEIPDPGVRDMVWYLGSFDAGHFFNDEEGSYLTGDKDFLFVSFPGITEFIRRDFIVTPLSTYDKRFKKNKRSNSIA